MLNPNPKMGRRGFFGLATLATSALALSACGGPQVGDKGGKEAVDIDLTKVEPAKSIDFWTNHPGKSQRIEQELSAKFEKETGIKVNIVTAGKDYEEIAQKFQTAQASKSGLPAVVVLSDVWWFRYYLDGTIIPLDSVIKQLKFDVGDYQDSLVKDYQYNNKQWAMPYARSTPLFYYNKDHWKAAGLPDRAPETWEEFSQWAPKIQKVNKSTPGYMHVFQHGALANYAGWTMQNLLWGNGAEWSKEFEITCNSPAAVDIIKWVQDSVIKDKWAGVSSKDNAQDLASGAVSSAISSTGSLVGIQKIAKFNLGVGFLPGGKVNRKSVCPTGGAGLGIPKSIKPEKQLAAAKLIQFLGKPENTLAFSAETGYMPVRKSADVKGLVAKNPLIETAMKQLPITRTQDYARAFLPGGDQEMAKAIGEILSEGKEPKVVLDKLKNTLEKIYNTQVKPKLS